MERISIVLVDDQPIFVEGFRLLCDRNADFYLAAAVGEINNLHAIVAGCVPNILFMDVANPSVSINQISSISKTFPTVKLVALTGARSISLAIQTLDAGAFGYILKQSSAEELTLAIQSISRGEKFITHGFSNALVSALQDEAARKKAALAIKLSIRENQIARLLMAGKTNKEIAYCLRISERTVKHYLTVMMQKLNVRNRTEVAIAAQAFDQGERNSELVH